MLTQADLQTVAQQLARAQAVAIITGAGISAESGIPTFRNAGGLWQQYNLDDLATPQGFQRNPKLVWEWYLWRKREYGQAQPNPAHNTIAAMEAVYPRFLVITQNVDTLHTQAGSRQVLEIHGNIQKARCTMCAHIFDNPLTDLPSTLIRCPTCGALARPHIVWFGEMYDADLMQQALDFLAATDVVVVIGTSGMVPTPVYLTQYAKQHGAYAVDINPEISEVSAHVDVHVQANAGETLPALWENVQALRK